MPAWKMPLCSVQVMVVKLGRNSRDCAATAPGHAGNQAPVECVCTQFCWIQKTPNECSLPSPPLAHSVVTIAERPGVRLTMDCIPSTSQIQTLKLGIVFIGSPCIHCVLILCSCKSTGM